MRDSHLTRRTIIQSLGAAAGAFALPSFANDSAQLGQLRTIVGLPPGGAADAFARILGSGIEEATKSPMVIDNRPGGQFAISVNALGAEPADGHTLLYIYNGYCAIQATQGLFNLEEQTTPVIRVGTSPIVLLAKADAPYNTIQEMLAYAKANPGDLNWGTFGEASLEYLKLAQIQKAGGFSATSVSYKGGPDLIKALLGGEIDCALMAGIFAKMFVPKGKVKILATLEPERMKEFPDTPTMTEVLPAVGPLNYWGGYVVKKGTPRAVVDQLAQTISKVTQRQDIKDRIAATGQMIDVNDNPDGFLREIQADTAWMNEAHKLLKK